MSDEVNDVHRIHKHLLVVWCVVGFPVSIALVFLTSQKWILVWNLALSIYTIVMEHALGMRQERKDEDGSAS